MNFNHKLNKTLEVVLVFVMSILVIDVLWQVASRYILASPSSFTDELAGFLLIWTGLLGAAYVAGRNEHLAIDILLQKTRESRKKQLEGVINIIVFLFALFVMVIGGSWLVYTRFALDVKSAALELPLGFVYIILPLSGLLIMYYSVFNIYVIYKKN
ncbi:MAG TPA: TRAP transporter small permease [Bacteroidales bacterium]|nr:TRAP transporter small permease [Bacteroidales bacterium]